MSLDRGTQIYMAILALIGLSLLLVWMLNLDLRLEEIDELIDRDAQISSYPYHFRALEIEGTTAVLSSPRSSAMPAVRFLGLVKPGLKNLNEQDPRLVAAQKELAEIQSKVRELVLSRKDIDSVSWRLDKQWYAEKGIWLE